jgi:lysophospholipase L1-like esterase
VIRNYGETLDAALARHVKVYVTSTLYRTDENHREIVDELNAYLKEWCNSNAQTFIDLNAKFSASGKLRQEFALKDGVHLNEAGYDTWAEMIRVSLKNRVQ